MIFHRPSLELTSRGTKPHAPFCLKAKERKEVMIWMNNLKFLDGFAAGFRRVVNLKTGKLTGVKSHDYHVIMEWLLSNMLQGYVHQDVVKMLAELSYFCRQLCAKEIKKEMMEKLEKWILVLLCKLEKIFPPGWFNPMQYLLIHLLYEAKVGDPMQYRWMYPFKRALKRLRHMVDNKARVEGCIIEKFKYKEIAYFTSVYFTEEHNVNALTMWYHLHQDDPHSDLSIFKSRGTTVGVGRIYHLSDEEWNSALLYMYTNLDEMTHYFS
jgi:hypothetical protein